MNSNKQNFYWLTYIRGVAAWWIVLFHIKGYLHEYLPEFLNVFIKRGYIAVDFFFILSGFVLSHIYYDKFCKLSWNNIKTYYLKRIVKVYPLHIIVMFLYLIIPLLYIIFNKQVDERFTIMSFIPTLFLIQNWVPYTSLREWTVWNVPTWAICVGMTAYILFPITISLYKKIDKRLYIPIQILLYIFIPIVYQSLDFHTIGDSFFDMGLFRGLTEFAIGMNLYLIYRNSVLIGGKYTYIINGTILFIITICMDHYNYYYIPFMCSLIILGVVNFSSRNSKPNKFFLFLSNLSFAVYIVHYFILELLKLSLKTEQAPITWITLYLGAVFTTSCFLHLIEDKINKRVFTR